MKKLLLVCAASTKLLNTVDEMSLETSLETETPNDFKYILAVIKASGGTFGDQYEHAEEKKLLTDEWETPPARRC